MKQEEDVWGWMLSTDFFLAGMGGGMLVLAAVIDLFMGFEVISPFARFVGPVLIAMGAGLLVLELGRPFQGWRVFMNPKAILTFGAWCMTLAIGFGGLLALLTLLRQLLPGQPWSGLSGVYAPLTVLSLVCGLIVATYPGVLLGRHKSRPFWSGPALTALFLLSSLATGAAAHLLCTAVLSMYVAVSSLDILRWAAAALVAGQLLLWPLYLYIKYSGTAAEALAAHRWSHGEMSRLFWFGLFGLGLLVPLALFIVPGASILGALLVLCGGVLMRWMVIKSGVARTWLPGEERYRSRLPKGDEAFLQAGRSK